MNPAFNALADAARHHLGVVVEPHGDSWLYTFRDGTICVPDGDTEGLLHEIAHYLCSETPDAPNYGCDDNTHGVEVVACLTERTLQERAGLKPHTPSGMMSLSYVGANLWADVDAELRADAEACLARAPEGFADAIVAALKLEGGDTCMYFTAGVTELEKEVAR